MIVDAVREHYTTLWGMPSRVIPLQSADYHIDVQVWDANANPEQVTMYATLGASAFPQPGHASGHRLEFYTGLLPEKDEVATVLAEVATYSTRRNVPIGHGHTITWLEPLWPGTQMCGVLVKRSDAEIIPRLSSPDDGLHVEFLAVRPLYPSEVRFKRDHSMDALIEHWWKHSVRFWDPNRPPEPS